MIFMRMYSRQGCITFIGGLYCGCIVIRTLSLPFQILASAGGVGHRSGFAHRRLRNSILEGGQLSNSPRPSRIAGRSGMADADASVPLPFWHPTTPALTAGFGNKIEAGEGMDNLNNHAIDYNDEDGDYVVDRPVPHSDYRGEKGYYCPFVKNRIVHVAVNHASK